MQDTKRGIFSQLSGLWWVSAAAVLLLSCKPKVGSSCDKGESRCLDPQTQLICSEGKMIAAPCRGEKGCWVEGGVRCDISGNQAGDVCSKDDQGAATCSADKRSQLVCLAGVYVSEPCRGPHACELSGDRALCDKSLMQVGDACRDAGAKACNLVGTQLLVCDSGKMATSLYCRGSAGCQASTSKLDCDLSVAALEDPCPLEMAGKHACSADRQSILQCKDQRFKLDQACDKGKLCRSHGGGIRCEADTGKAD